MSVSTNRVFMMGEVCDVPRTVIFSETSKAVQFGLRTWESYTAKTGEKKEFSDYHRVHVTAPKAMEVAAALAKGDHVELFGMMRNRLWKKSDGSEQRITEVNIKSFGHELQVCEKFESPVTQAISFRSDELDDEVPF